jgi:two-component system chemotaxis response regulator CheB
MAPIRVLVVDDSALVRSLLAEIINREADMECIGAASDPLVARELIRSLNPDVITLDVEMPRMDGLDFLSRLMRLRPMPVVMVSTLTERGAQATFRALELGAVDFVAKPKIGIADGLRGLAADLTAKLRIAARATVRRASAAPSFESAAQMSAPGLARARTTAPLPASSPAPAGAASHPRLGVHVPDAVILIGASTGGTEATRALLMQLPPDAPPVLITQHMPPGFTRGYAERLDGQCSIRVSEARHDEPLRQGHACIAPGGMHLAVARDGAGYRARVFDGEAVNRHKPSVEVLFDSAARVVGAHAIGVMLTGMGADGAVAMRAMRDAGAYNLAQDEASCVVFGMPREAIAAGAVHEVLPLAGIAPRLIERLQAMRAEAIGAA